MKSGFSACAITFQMQSNIDELFKDFLFDTNKQMSGCVIMSIFYSFMTRMIIFRDNLSGIIKYSSCKGNE